MQRAQEYGAQLAAHLALLDVEGKQAQHAAHFGKLVYQVDRKELWIAQEDSVWSRGERLQVSYELPRVPAPGNGARSVVSEEPCDAFKAVSEGGHHEPLACASVITKQLRQSRKIRGAF